MAIAVGQPAPDLQLQDTHGHLIRLSDHLDKQHVVLSFHPLAWTNVCAAQMLSFDRLSDEFRKRDSVVFGVNVDPLPSKKAWSAALGLSSLSLLSDFEPKGAVADEYGILRQEGFSERAIIVIDKAGIVRWVNVYPISQLPDSQEVLEVVDGL